MVLGFDTSAYTTSLAVVEDGELLHEERRMLEVKPGARGLRQQEAYYRHHQHLQEMLAGVIEALDLPDLTGLKAVGVSTKPRPEESSFMPVFLAGSQVAGTLAMALGIPLIAYDHQRGHLRAALYRLDKRPQAPFYALHLSGGTTEILKVGEDLTGDIVGRTLDLSFGKVIDRVGVALGLPFPAGGHLETLAGDTRPSDAYAYHLKGLDLNLSGVESQALRDIDRKVDPKIIAAKIQHTCARCLEDLIHQLTGEVVLTGGVMRNAYIRDYLEEQLGDRLLFSDPRYASDNAVGVALHAEEAISCN